MLLKFSGILWSVLITASVALGISGPMISSSSKVVGPAEGSIVGLGSSNAAGLLQKAFRRRSKRAYDIPAYDFPFPHLLLTPLVGVARVNTLPDRISATPLTTAPARVESIAIKEVIRSVLSAINETETQSLTAAVTTKAPERMLAVTSASATTLSKMVDDDIPSSTKLPEVSISFPNSGKNNKTSDVAAKLKPGAECLRSVCDDAPFDKILSVNNKIIAMKDSRMYRIRPNGSPAKQPKLLDGLEEDITATLEMRGAHYIFLGNAYLKYTETLKPAYDDQPRPVVRGFPGVPVPVDGAFQLNDHTFVFFSGTKFVYYQPDAEVNVDPRFSPQPIRSITGAPPRADSVFTKENSVYIYRKETLYEMTDGEMTVERSSPLVSTQSGGWLQCDDLISLPCKN